MKIAFVETEKWEEDYFKKRLGSVECLFYESTLQATTNVAADAEILVTFIHSKLDAAAVAKFPRLKLIATSSTGYDHIDLSFCQAHNITVCNVPTYGENTVAEHTFGLILALSRHLPESFQRTRDHNFSVDGLRGFDLRGKTLGVVGTGHIGTFVIKIAQGFGLKILAYDPCPKPEFSYVSLEKLLAESDIITLHVPLLSATKHLLNATNLKLIKPGSYLINTARGGLVETAALLEALNSGQLAGAGLDVLEEEDCLVEERDVASPGFLARCDYKTLLENNVLCRHPKVLLTPHNAFNSEEAVRRILETTILNIQSFLAGAPSNIVKPC